MVNLGNIKCILSWMRCDGYILPTISCPISSQTEEHKSRLNHNNVVLKVRHHISGVWSPCVVGFATHTYIHRLLTLVVNNLLEYTKKLERFPIDCIPLHLYKCQNEVYIYSKANPWFTAYLSIQRSVNYTLPRCWLFFPFSPLRQNLRNFSTWAQAYHILNIRGLNIPQPHNASSANSNYLVIFFHASLIMFLFQYRLQNKEEDKHKSNALNTRITKNNDGCNAERMLEKGIPRIENINTWIWQGREADPMKILLLQLEQRRRYCWCWWY